MKVKILVILAIFFFFKSGFSQVNTQWTARYNGISNNNDAATCMALDNSGNVYTAGIFNGITDFDPGAGTYTLNSVGSFDIYVQKLDAFTLNFYL